VRTDDILTVTSAEFHRNIGAYRLEAVSFPFLSICQCAIYR
jgi:hypothetical protein